MKLLAILLIALLLVLSEAHPNECIHECGNEILPVCALENIEGEMPRTFLNLCHWFRHACNDHLNYQYVRDGRCRDEPTEPENCNYRCMDNYRPVCALEKGENHEQNTFNNVCDWYNHACYTHPEHNPNDLMHDYEYVKDGECNDVEPEPEIPDHCDHQCSNLYLPLCGLEKGDGKEPITFINHCHLFEHYCRNHEEFEYIKGGACDDLVEPQPYYDCNYHCSEREHPVCALLKGEGKIPMTYLNRCKFREHICNTHEEIEYIVEGRCPEIEYECEYECSTDYIPVCALEKGEGKEPITYLNLCKLHEHMCETHEEYEYVRDGECPKEPNHPTRCNYECPEESHHVCALERGENKKPTTFRNICEFFKHVCLTHEHYEYVRDGDCPIEPESAK